MFGCLFGLIRRIGCLILLVVGGFVAFQWLAWPDVAELAIRDPRTTAFIDDYRERHGRDAPFEWRWVSYGRISDNLKQAVIVAEDIDFFSHNGFAVEELKNAVQDAVLEGESLRGASTLSQQLVKNLWLSPSRNPWRKAKEALLTVQLERQVPKHRINEIYLNVVEFAPGVYGAEAAALHGYRRSAAGLTVRQAAELAACLPSPSSCGPNGGGDDHRQRAERIERRVGKADWIKREL